MTFGLTDGWWKLQRFPGATSPSAAQCRVLASVAGRGRIPGDGCRSLPVRRRVGPLSTGDPDQSSVHDRPAGRSADSRSETREPEWSRVNRSIIEPAGNLADPGSRPRHRKFDGVCDRVRWRPLCPGGTGREFRGSWRIALSDPPRGTPPTFTDLCKTRSRTARTCVTPWFTFGVAPLRTRRPRPSGNRVRSIPAAACSI